MPIFKHLSPAFFIIPGSFDITADVIVIIPFTIAIIAPAILNIEIPNFITFPRFSPIMSAQVSPVSPNPCDGSSPADATIFNRLSDFTYNE